MIAEKAVLDYIVAKARSLLNPRVIILFGSRADGSATPRSDYDIAVEMPSPDESLWARFVIEVQNGAPTLCAVDLIPLHKDIRFELRQNISKKGIVLYEQKS